jgi:Na+/proline symporter
MAGQATDYHHGEMDIHAQQATFKAVMNGTKWACLVVAVGVLFFTLLFCTTAGFFTAFVTAVVVAILGGVLLRSRPPAH